MTALDTSVVVPALAGWHEAHDQTRRRAAGASVPAHVLLESYSVLTRLPSPHRIDANVAAQLLAGWFPPPRVLHLDRAAARSLINRLAIAGITGGASYDGLVAVTATAHDEVLLTRDTRAVATYERLGIAYELIE